MFTDEYYGPGSRKSSLSLTQAQTLSPSHSNTVPGSKPLWRHQIDLRAIRLAVQARHSEPTSVEDHGGHILGSIRRAEEHFLRTVDKGEAT